MYFPAPLGDLPNSQWCSDRNPQGSCSPLTNICKPMYATTLATFKGLQNEINRALGRIAVAVDGRIGPETMRGVTMAAAALGIGGLPVFSHCDQLAGMADAVLSMLRAANAAAGRGAVAAPVPPRASQPAADGTVLNPPDSMLDKLSASVGGKTNMAMLGVGALLLFAMGPLGGKMSSRPKRRKAAKRTRRTTRRRRRR